MYILKRILISLHTAVSFIKILLKYYCCMRILLLGNLLPTMPSKNCNIRDRLDILKNYGSIVHHENFVPKTLFDFLMKYT